MTERFRELYLEIKEIFHVAKHAEYNQLNDDQWLLDLSFLTNLTNMLNDLNVELQGKDKTVISMINSVNSFKQKLQHLSSKLQRQDLANFKSLVVELETQGKACVQLYGACYTEQIENCLSEFDKHFQDFVLLEPVTILLFYPFREDTEIDPLASKTETLFHGNFSGVQIPFHQD